MNRTAADFLVHCFSPSETIALPLRRKILTSMTRRIVAVESVLTRRKIS
jgi:hypothetical protein